MKIVRNAALGIALLGMVGLGACQNMGEKETLGGLGGAAVGGLAGAQIGGGSGQLAATAVGALLGFFIGQEVGKSLDKADQLYAERTAGQALESNPSGQSSAWSNPDSGNSGTITPQRTYQKAEGTYCREFQQTISVGGRTEEAYGTACRQEGGTWRIVN
ncbi:MAG: RT0821/Lpp0805 family surface protein [Alphaproteobacteria bacterium]|nr:RT0821/Lpp0805 family surface protein [Alphaproteobacteria bacterium]